MRKLIAAMNMTLDGFCDHTAMSADDEIHDHYTQLLRNAGTLLYGRITYQLMESYWPAVVKNPTGNKSTDDFAIAIDNASKIVFSKTLKQVDWKNTELKKEIRKEEILELKRQEGKYMLTGSPSLIVALAKLDLIDEFQIAVHPVVLGTGLALFKNITDRIDLQLLKTKTFGCGAVMFHYEPEKKISMRMRNTENDVQLRKFLNTYYPFSAAELSTITGKFKNKLIKKNGYLLKPGDVCKDLVFVQKGCLRLYYLKDDIEVSVWFAFSNASAIEISSFISENPSDYFLQAIEDSEVSYLPKTALKKLFQTQPNMQEMMRRFWEDVILNLINRFTALQKDSAEKRYLDLLNKPAYLEKIPQKYLASFIGVTPTSLSRIRKQLVKKR